jgi:hypothetical protein
VANTLNLFRNGAGLLAKAFGVGFIVWLERSGTQRTHNARELMETQ